MSNLARQELFFGRFFTVDEMVECIEAVTADQIQHDRAGLLRRQAGRPGRAWAPQRSGVHSRRTCLLIHDASLSRDRGAVIRGSRFFAPCDLLICAALSACVRFAIDIATLKPQGYVSDFAIRCRRRSPKRSWKPSVPRVEKATGVQMAFVTLRSLEGEPLEDFTNDLYRSWGVGQKGKDEGLLLLLVVRDRRSRLEIGRGLEEHIPDGMAGCCFARCGRSCSRTQYGEALSTAAHSLATRIAQAKGVQIPDTAPLRRRPPPQATGVDIPWPLILGGIFLLFWIMGMGGRRGGRGGGGGFLPGIILGNMMGRAPTAATAAAASAVTTPAAASADLAAAIPVAAAHRATGRWNGSYQNWSIGWQKRTASGLVVGRPVWLGCGSRRQGSAVGLQRPVCAEAGDAARTGGVRAGLSLVARDEESRLRCC